VKNISKKAVNLLAGLGETPEEIAATLLGSGYKGLQGDGKGCPCGSCLRDHLEVVVHVARTYVVVHGDNETSTSPLPHHVQDFITLFDSGHFPELIRK